MKKALGKITKMFRLPAPSLRGKSDVDNIGVCVRAGGEAVLFLFLLLLFSCTQRERSKDASPSALKYALRTTPVKDQGKVEACWIYAYLACIETERIENYGDSMNLSPIWLVRNLLLEQASESYLSQGNMPISVRGIGPDAERLLKQYGMVQWSTYCPDDINSKALTRIVRQKVKIAINNRMGLERLNKDVDEALPFIPHNLRKGFYLYSAHYTPKQFGESILYGIKFSWLTSYKHHPYGESFVLEIPDNHHRHALMNVPVQDMYSQVIEALKNHHPVYWEGQMPRNRKPSIDGDIATLRQSALERFTTTDQHAMAIVGQTKTKQGETLFICKNSWGKDWGIKGYCLMSKEDFLINTILVGVVGER